MKTILLVALITLCFAALAFGQPRPVDNSRSGEKAKPAPESFAAKYEGGMFGFNDKEAGTLKFDDANDRLIFFGKEQKEIFAIPYGSLLVIYPQSQSVTSTAGNVISQIPLPGASLAGFIKEKRRYLIIQYEDLDIDAKGAVNFKLEDKALLDSVLQTLAEKAQLSQRGEAYYRPKAVKKSDPN
ncbi:MAG: hypothetical protein KA746_10260 [Pyrinomonadaceae bacterium]|nr:hypothetical protein [Pyrinomonadaceae bacterium]MBP6213037.1 hypothetical protein [Pyrinomonadaceae bacterium]